MIGQPLLYASTWRLLDRLADLDIMMHEVTPKALNSQEIDQFSYSRFHADYEAIHQLCRLFVDGASLSDVAGKTQMRTFLVDMNRLFEEFVTASLAHNLPNEFAVLPQWRMFLSRGRQVAMRPDIVITRNGRPVLVADCKYKVTGVDQFDNHDYYQILAYCTALGINKGLMIVPEHEQPAAAEVAVRQSPITIHRHTISLESVALPFSSSDDHLTSNVVALLAF